MYGLLYDIKCSAARALERVIGCVTVKDKRANSHNYLDCCAHDLKFRTDSVWWTSLGWPALRASLFGTFLQTLQELHGYATEGVLFYLRAAVHRRSQRPPKGLGISKTVEATYSAQART